MPTLLRMVESILESTFGPRVGHETLSNMTTNDSRALAALRPSVLGEAASTPTYDGTSQANGGAAVATDLARFRGFRDPVDFPLIAAGQPRGFDELGS